MTAERRLLLHIGTHKTGTTSFQKSLKVNRQALIARGIRPVLDRVYRDGAYREHRAGQHFTFAHLILRPEVMTSQRINGHVPSPGDRVRARRLDRMAERIRASDSADVILSSEQLCLLRTDEERERLARFVAQTGRAVRTVCAFREVEDWRASWHDELIKRDDGRTAVIDAQPEDARITAPWYFDTDAIRGFWETFNLTEIAFDKSADMVARVYEAFGIEAVGLATDLRINTRKAP